MSFSDIALALSSGFITYQKRFPTPVAIQGEVFQHRGGCYLCVGLLSALRADQKTVFIDFHIPLPRSELAEQAGLEPTHRNPPVNGLAIRRSTCYAYCSVWGGDPEGTLTLTLDRFGEASLFQQTAAVLRERKRTFGCMIQPGTDGWGRTSTRRVQSPVHRLLCYIGIFSSVRDFKFSFLIFSGAGFYAPPPLFPIPPCASFFVATYIVLL